MAVGNSEVTFILHQTCRTCLININENEMEPIPIFTETSNATAPDIILNAFSFLKLKVEILNVLPYVTMIRLSFQLKLARDDGLPQQICNDCQTNLLNIREFRKVCEQSQDILEKFFKLSSESITLATAPSKLVTVSIAELSEPNFSDFEFLNIDNVDDNVGYDTKIEVLRKDSSSNWCITYTTHIYISGSSCG